MSQSALAVELKGIWKRFPGVIANSDINLKVASGTVHAIVGENGAGKSTLMKILYGMQKADEGTISINGSNLIFNSPSDAIDSGIGMVHQHFMLADNFTVLENIVLGSEPKNGIRLDFAKARKQISEIAAENGLAVDPDVLVSELGVGDRQRIEILKVLYRGAKILILDEPTAVLVPHEVDELFNTLRDLKKEGLTVIFISHKLDEVLSIADEITVIRQGTTVGSVNPHTQNVSARDLAEMMVGNELPTPESVGDTIRDEVVLKVENLSVFAKGGKALVDNVSFQIRAGEIVGIAGVEGNGQAEILDALMGIEAATGQVFFKSEDITHKSTRHRRELGIGFIPEDRHRQALMLEAPLWENRMLGHQTRAPNAKGIWLTPRSAKADTKRIVEEYDVRTPSIDVLASALSGGNQQKVAIGKWLTADSEIIIFDEPTRGIDVGAKSEIYKLMNDLIDQGKSIVMISSELPEILRMSHRIVVMCEGRITGELLNKEANQESIMALATMRN
mgnify:FL=1